MQPRKKPLHLIVDFLYCMWEYAKEQITREIGAVSDLGQKIIVLVFVLRLYLKCHRRFR